MRRPDGTGVRFGLGFFSSIWVGQPRLRHRGQARPGTPEARKKQRQKLQGVRSGAAARSTILVVKGISCPDFTSCQAIPLHLVLHFSIFPTRRGLHKAYLMPVLAILMTFGQNRWLLGRVLGHFRTIEAQRWREIGKSFNCAVHATECCSFFAQHSHNLAYSQNEEKFPPCAFHNFSCTLSAL